MHQLRGEVEKRLVEKETNRGGGKASNETCKEWGKKNRGPWSLKIKLISGVRLGFSVLL